MARGKDRIGIGAVALAALLVSLPLFAKETRIQRPSARSQSESAERFNARPFPHLLRKGDVRPAGADEPRRGNGRWEAAVAAPTVTRSRPRLLSDHGRDPREAIRNLRALREEAVPETVRILALRVDFTKDSALDESTGDGRFDLRSNDEAKIPVDPPPHNKRYFERHLEALRRYYDVQTSGGLVLEYDVFPAENDSAYHLPDTQRYGPWIFSVSSDSILARAERFVRESVSLADSLDPAIDWRRYNSFLVFHAGADFQGDVRQDTSYDIPSFNLFLGDSLEVITGGEDSVRVNLVMVVPETVSQDEFLGALNGVMAHEFGHQLGFFDLYDVFTGLPVVGSFSLMDSGEGMFALMPDPTDTTQIVAVRGALPSSVDPFHRIVFPFFNTRIHEGADGETFPLSGVLQNNDLLYLPIHLSEYFLAETRPIDYNGDGQVVLRADPETGVILGPEPLEEGSEDPLARLEYDYLLPGGGVIVWHIDELAAITGLNSPYGSINIFSDRLGVDVEEADGIQDIGTASSEFFGGPYDPFFVGGFSRFDPTTVPNTQSNDRTETGIAMEVVDSIQVTMRVRVGRARQAEGFPIALIGTPVPEALSQADLDLDGFDELLMAAGSALFAFRSDGSGFADGGERVLFSLFPAPLEEGARVVWGFDGAPSGGCAVLARAGGQAWWFDGPTAGLIGSWPDDPQRAWISAGPVLTEGVLIAGTLDGALVGLRPDGGTALKAWESRVSGAIDSITALAAGRFDPSGLVYVAGGTSEGSVFLGSAVDPTQAPALTGAWPVDVGAGPVRDLLLLQAPIRYGEAPQTLLLATTLDRKIDLRDLGGASIEGWPKTVADTLAGSPAVGDLDGDGIIEICAVTRAGDLHLWDLSGASEPGWPRSLWEPDRNRRPEGSAGPRIWDLGGDGSLDLIVLRGDGVQIAIGFDGRPSSGWPFATGAIGGSGPIRMETPSGRGLWFATNILSDSLIAVSGLSPALAEDPIDADLPGTYPGPGVDGGRSGLYPLAMVPAPVGADRFLEASSVIFHPNPVKEDHLKIRYVLGSPASMRLTAFDLSGKPAAETRWQGRSGAGGDLHEWDLSGLAPGVYVMRLEVEGEGAGAGESRTLTRTVAVVR